jgi:hypothetical protein
VNGPASALPLASVLPTILFVGMVMAAVVGVMALVSRKDIYDEIGGGGLSMEHDQDPASERPSGDEVAREIDFQSESDDPAVARAERELEIRQLLEARSARVVRNGGDPLDVEAELARLLALDEVPFDAGGAASGGAAGERAEQELEIRQMLEARSARRVRKGGEPLDVEAELKRLLRGAEDQV